MGAVVGGLWVSVLGYMCGYVCKVRGVRARGIRKRCVGTYLEGVRGRVCWGRRDVGTYVGGV